MRRSFSRNRLSRVLMALLVLLIFAFLAASASADTFITGGAHGITGGRGGGWINTDLRFASCQREYWFNGDLMGNVDLSNATYSAWADVGTSCDTPPRSSGLESFSATGVVSGPIPVPVTATLDPMFGIWNINPVTWTVNSSVSGWYLYDWGDWYAANWSYSGYAFSLPAVFTFELSGTIDYPQLDSKMEFSGTIPSPVPEPASIALLLTGLGAGAGSFRKKIAKCIECRGTVK